MTAADYPRDPGAVTPRWLADTLRTTLPGLPAIESFAGSTIGTGQVGQFIRFDLQYAAEPPVGSPFSVVGKFASADPASRAAGRVLRPLTHGALKLAGSLRRWRRGSPR